MTRPARGKTPGRRRRRIPLGHLDRVFKPRSIAFYGASNNPMTMGTGQLAILMMSGYEGAIYPVHPTETEVLGLKAYGSIGELPEIPDLVFMVLPTDIVARILDECGRAGVRAAVVVSGGFREVGARGVEKERELVDAAHRHDITLIGPNCIGVGNFNIGLNTTYSPYEQEPGGVTVISQSGTYSCHIYGYTRRIGIGLSHTVSVGNSSVTDLTDCLEYFADETTTRSIALYIEGIRDGDRFMRVASEAVKKKPVVALYVGGTGAGARAGMSHTGALAGDDELYDGIFHQTGVIRAYTIEEMLDWCWALSRMPPPAGNRMCILTNSGGPGASMADSCVRAGLEVPVFSETLQERLRDILPHTSSVANPVDITFFMDMNAMYHTIPGIILESDEVDGIVMYGIYGSRLYRILKDNLGDIVPFAVDEAFPYIKSILDRFKELPGECGKPVLVSSFWYEEDDAVRYLSASGIPVFSSPERAVGAMAALYRYGRTAARID